MRIIGICGRAQNGKSTLAKHLVDTYGLVEVSFAQPLKSCCMEAFGFDKDQVFGDKKDTIDPLWGVAPRRVLQYVGTEFFRNSISKLVDGCGHNFWVIRARKEISRLLEMGKGVVVSDVGFPMKWIL